MNDDARKSTVLQAEEAILKLADEMERAQANADDFDAMRQKLEEAQTAFQQTSASMQEIHTLLVETTQAAQGAMQSVSEASCRALQEAIQRLQETSQRVQGIECQVQDTSREMQQAIACAVEQMIGVSVSQSQRLIAALNEQAHSREYRLARLVSLVRWAVILGALATAGSVACVLLLVLKG